MSGVRPGPPPEDLAERDSEFSGRAWVLDRIEQFIEAGQGATLLVVAKPGVGKTAVAVRLVRLSRGEVTAPAGLAVPRIHAAHFCRAGHYASIDPVGVCEHLSAQLATTVPGFAERLTAPAGPAGSAVRIDQSIGHAEAGVTITAIGSLTIAERDPRAAFDILIRRPLQALSAAAAGPPPIVLLIDGLDESVESSMSSGRTLVDLLAVELARPIPGVKWVLSTRAEYVAGRLAKSVDERLDLSADAPPHADDVLGYAERRLAPVLGDAGRALARRVAAAADGNFLYAHHVINDVLAADPIPADVTSMPLPDGLAGIYGGFLDRKIGIGDEWRNYCRPVLGALVQARGSGLTIEDLEVVTGLPPSRVADTVAELSPYLSGNERTGLTVYHQSLRDYLRTQGPHFVYPREASARIVDGLAPGPRGERRWDQAGAHILEHGIYYAADAGREGEFLADPSFLVHVDPQVMLTALAALSVGGTVSEDQQGAPAAADLADDGAALAAAIYRTSAHLYPNLPPERRRQLLALDAARWGNAKLAVSVEAVPVAGHSLSPARVRWATGSRLSPAQSAVLAAGTSPIHAVATALIDGRPVAVTTSGRDVLAWDLAARTMLRWLGSHDDLAYGVAVGVLDGQPIAVSGGHDYTVRIWDLESGLQAGELTGNRGWVDPVAIGESDGRLVAVAGDTDGCVLVWDLATRALIDGPLTGHEGPVEAIALGELEGRQVAVSGGFDGEIRIWDLARHAQIGKPLTGHPGNVLAIALTELDGRQVAVSGGNDGAMRIWDLAKGRQVGKPLAAKSGGIRTLAVGSMGSRTLAVTAGFDGKGWVLDLASRALVGEPLTSHGIRAVDFTVLDGRPVVVSGGSDGTVRLWDLTRQVRAGKLEGHDGHVSAVALGTLAGGRVVVSGGYDSSIRVWDAATGHQEFVLAAGGSLVESIAVGPIGARETAIAGYSSGELQIWDLGRREPASDPMVDPDGHSSAAAAIALGVLNGRQIAVSSGLDGHIRVWDLTSATLLEMPLELPGGTGVRALALARLDAGPVVVAGCTDASVRIWDLAARAQQRVPLAGHSTLYWVQGVAAGIIDGRQVAVTGADDLRIWDLITHEQVGESLLGDASVTALAANQIGEGVMAVVGCSDRTVRICDLRTGHTRVVLSMPEVPTAVAFTAGLLAIAFDYEIAVYEMSDKHAEDQAR
jgi:WD40 repeat protein